MAEADEPAGSCPTCFSRDPRDPLLCDVCRSRLRSWLGDIPGLVVELRERAAELAEPIDHRPYIATVVERDEDTKKVVRSWRELTMRPADPVAYHLTSGTSSSPSRGGPVSGSKEQQLPIRVDPLDLAAAARGLSARAELDVDAIGHVAVASTLDFWVQDWRDARGGLEGRPSPFVPALSSWLLRRVDDAMDTHSAIDEFFHDIRSAHGALRGQLGLVDVPDYKRGVPCPKCETLSLFRDNGSDWIECGYCRKLLKLTEYDAYVAALAAQARREKAA